MNKEKTTGKKQVKRTSSPYQRAIIKLAKLGLLERVRMDGFTKATHVRLTERGREEPERLQ